MFDIWSRWYRVSSSKNMFSYSWSANLEGGKVKIAWSTASGGIIWTTYKRNVHYIWQIEEITNNDYSSES